MRDFLSFVTLEKYFNILFTFLFLFLLGLLVIKIEQQLSTYKSDKYKEVNNFFETLDHSLDDKINAVTYLQSSAESFFNHQVAECDNLFPLLSQVPGKEYFALDDAYPKNMEVAFKSNVTGYSTLSNIDPNELCMALSLNSLFYSVSSEVKESAWVYYTSKEGFINLFPYVSSNDFHLLKSDLEKEYFTYGLPEVNPKRSIYWTPLYVDAGGLGLMVSLGKPVYHENAFRGVVALDVTVTHLEDLLLHIRDLKGSAFIVNKQDQILSANNIRGFDKQKVVKVDGLISNEILESIKKESDLTETSDYYIVHKNFKNAPWEFVYFIDKKEIYWTIFFKALPFVILFLFIGIIKALINKVIHTQKELETLNRYLEEDVKKKVKELNIQKSNYEMLFEQSSAGICLLKDARIIECNDTMVKMFGYKKNEEMKGHFMLSFSPKFQPSGEKSRTLAHEIQTFFIEKKEYGFEWQFKRKEGDLFYADITSKIIQIDGEKIIQIIFRDISKRKNLEKDNEAQMYQLIQQSRLAQMGEMLSMISHQWRQPLSSISMVMIGLEMKIQMGKLPRNSSEEVRESDTYLLEHISKVNTYIQYLSNTIDDFKNFFQPQKSKKHFNINALIDQTIELIAPTLESKRVTIERDYQLKEELISYENEIKQVILNVLNNAKDALMDYRSDSRTIKIRTFGKEDHCVIEIEDNGGGVCNEYVSKIFDPYFSTKSKNGTGLGLYMSKTIIEAHCRGTIRVENTKEGACFRITLPLMQDETVLQEAFSADLIEAP